MAQVTLPDGNTVSVPDFAMEKTQEDMKKLLQAIVGSDKNALKVYGKLIDEIKDNGSEAEQAAKEAKQLQKDQIKTTDKVAGAVKSAMSAPDGLFNGIKKVDGWLSKSFMTLGSSALSGALLLGNAVKGIGDDLLGLQQQGVGFSDSTGSAEKLIADLNYLGLTSQDAAEVMGDFGGVVQVMGKGAFADIQRSFSNITNSGGALGLSMLASSKVLAEDLDLRKTLGMLDQMDANAQAQRSSDLYKQQLKAAQALGKSVEEIRDGNNNLLKENMNFQMTQARLLAGMGKDAATKYLESVESLSTEFQGMGLSATMQDAMLTYMSEPVASLAEGGAELYEALSTVGVEGAEIADQMQQIGKLMNGSAAEQEEGRKLMAQFGPKLQQTLGNLSAEQIERMQNLVNEGGPAANMINELFKSSQLAKSSLQGAANSVGSFSSGLAKGAQAYGAALDSIGGAMSGAMTDISSLFAEPAGAFADALVKDTILRNDEGEILNKNGIAMTRMAKLYDENGEVVGEQLETIKDYNDLSEEQKKQMTGTQSVMGAFRDAIQVVRQTMATAFGSVVGDGTSLADTIRSKIVPAIQDFAKWFAGDGIVMFKNGFDIVSGVLETFGDVLGFVKYIITDKLMPAFTSISDFITSLFGGEKTEDGAEGAKTDFKALGKGIGLAVVGLFAFTKAFKLASAAVSVGSKLKGMIGGAGKTVATAAGGAGNAGSAVAKGGAGFTKTIAKAGASIGSAIKSLGKGIGGAIQGLAEGIGKGVAAVGKGIGTALGGILKGLASGLAAFANPAILIGAGILGGSIALIGAGIAGAAWLIGSALPTFAEGLKSFADLDGDNLVSVAKGIGAIGVAMAAMGAGGAAGAVGGAVTGVIEGIGSFFGADSPLDKLKEFAAYDIDVAKVLYNASAFTAFGDAMSSIGAALAGSALGGMLTGLASFIGADPISMLNKFADEQINVAGLDTNIAGLTKLEELFAQYAGLEVPQGLNINKSAGATRAPAGAASKINPSLGQPAIMGGSGMGEAVMSETQSLDTESIIAQGQAATGGAGSAAGATLNGVNSNANEMLESIMSQQLAETKKNNALLARIETGVQDTF